ncbi:tyrosine-protein phosphatase [Algivirga pacifica]|uniref:protein-tyrosine-phosphatase n=1 Tax=Algivirga pacifica TaxID=1162670 RepID=A0ABP9D867_9BACT
MLFSLFKKKKKKAQRDLPPVLVDMHSHILPGIDDGSKNMEETIIMLKEFQSLGYKKMIMTPHIMMDFFRNTPEIVLGKLEEVKVAAKDAGIHMELEAAAEYYLDEAFIEMIESGAPLLTFGDNYVLFELSYMNESPLIDKAIFMLKSRGYKPVLAHPERYLYLGGKYQTFIDLKSKGVLLQLNILSFIGYYSKGSLDLAERLIKDKLVAFISSDCHKPRHIEKLIKARETELYQDALELSLLNNSLLTNTEQ